jgi:hypothetical protein
LMCSAAHQPMPLIPTPRTLSFPPFIGGRNYHGSVHVLANLDGPLIVSGSWANPGT